MSERHRPDLFAIAAAGVAVVMAVIYIWLIRQQGDEPLAWVLGVLLLGAVLAGYGARNTSPHRRTALLSAGLVLTALGVLAMFSIGLPIIVAGILCFISAARTPPSLSATSGR